MVEHLDIIIPALVTVGSAIVGAMVWIIKRLLGLERHVYKEMNINNKALAVLETSQSNLRKEFDKDSKRNSDDHERILTRMDTNHERTMTRLDSLVKLARNGNGRT